MEIQKVKISDLPVTEDLNGLKTLGTTAENTSKAAELTFIADAATSANEAATNANQAAENANTSASNADAKAEVAQKAADNATASANQADQAAVNANTATTRATAAAEKAENAADVAIGVVNEAQQATANANQAAQSANEAATNANQAAENANTSASNADAKAEVAQKAADNATASANQADQAAVNANTATTRATAAAEKAENAADVAIGVVNEAQQATANANQAAQSANEAATNANQAAASANDAATEAHTQAEYAKTQGDYAKAEGDRVLAEKGQPGGLAELDESGRVPSSQLPSYVDDVINVATYSQLPNPGESGKIYITEDTNLAYRWSGTGYAEISPSLALGTTAETAGRGDWTHEAYNHSLIKDGSNPHKTTFASLPDKDKVWTSDNFNPDNYLPKTTPTADGGVIVNGETAVGKRPYLKFHIPGVNHSQFVMDENGTVNLLNGSDQTPGAFKSFSAGAIFSNGKRVWDSGNLNPDDKFGFSAAQLSDLNNAPNNAFFVGAYNAANAPVADSWSNGFTISYGNNPDFRKQFVYAGEKWWTRGRDGVNWGTWRQIWDSGSFDPNSYLPLSGNKTITGDVSLASGVRLVEAAKNIIGRFVFGGDTKARTVVGTADVDTLLVSSNPLKRHTGGSEYTVYDSGNLDNATTSKAGLMSVADKTKLDGLSGGGLNIPASGEVAISGWMYNGKQVYAQRWTGEFTGVAKNLTTIEGLSAILMKGGTLFLYGSQSNSVGLGSSQWNQTTGDIARISDLQYNLLTGSVTVAAWYGGTSSPTTVNWSYEVWAAYTK